MLKDIVEARPAGEHKLYLRFEDGVEGEIDLSKLIEFKCVFEPLRDVREVAKVRVDAEHGTVSWPNGADLDPDVLYSLLTGNDRVEAPGGSLTCRARRLDCMHRGLVNGRRGRADNAREFKLQCEEQERVPGRLRFSADRLLRPVEVPHGVRGQDEVRGRDPLVLARDGLARQRRGDRRPKSS